MKKPGKLIFLLLFVASLFLYFYKYPKMLTFDADQEFYANEYLKIAGERKFTLLGIETSIGGMFVGPLYTYGSSLVYRVFGADPIGIFLVTLIFASLNPSFTYYFFAKLKNQEVGLLCGFLVLVSASIWNKAFAPSAINFLYPMGLFFFYTLVRLKEHKNYLLWLGLILAATLQIHLSLFFFFPIAIIFLLWQRWITKKNTGLLVRAILIIVVSLSPLLIFDLRHNFFISSNLWKFIIQNTSLPSNNTSVFFGLAELFSHILTPKPGILVYLFLAGVLAFFLRRFKKDFTYRTIGLIYMVSIVLFLLYQGPKPDYFFYFLLPAFFLVVADFVVEISRNKLLKYPVYLFLIVLALQNLQFIGSTLNHYNFRLKKEVARYIKTQSQDKKVKISYDTELGLGFGFDYLLRYEGVAIDNNSYEENYHIVIRNYGNYPGIEFREPGSPVSIKVVKLAKEREM